MSYIDIYRELKEDPNCIYKKKEPMKVNLIETEVTQGSDICDDKLIIKNTSISALDKQEGGAHYKQGSIQPIEYIHANNLSFLEGNVVKYVTRHKSKNGAEDIRKAIHYLEMILQFEYEQRG